jgi:hypothetical protein
VRRALLTLHIVVSVGLLGDSAGFLAVAIQGATTDNPGLAAASYRTLSMFALTVATGLAVYKPGRRTSRRRRGPDSSAG